MFNNGCKGPHLLRSTHESSPNLLATSFSKVSGRYMLKHGHITHENRPTPIPDYPPKFHHEWPIVSEETCFCNAVPHKQCSSSYDLPNNMFVWSSWMMRMLKHVQNALNIPYGTKSATFFLTPWTRKCMIWQWSHYSYAKIYHSICA